MPIHFQGQQSNGGAGWGAGLLALLALAICAATVASGHLAGEGLTKCIGAGAAAVVAAAFALASRR